MAAVTPPTLEEFQATYQPPHELLVPEEPLSLLFWQPNEIFTKLSRCLFETFLESGNVRLNLHTDIQEGSSPKSANNTQFAKLSLHAAYVPLSIDPRAIVAQRLRLLKACAVYSLIHPHVTDCTDLFP